MAEHGAEAQMQASRKQQGKPPKQGFKAWLKDVLVIFLTALVIALVVKGLIIDSRVVPSASMHPTIAVGDRVLMFRLSYFGERVPARGDIVVFRAPEEFADEKDLLKRVIGLPGETVEVKEGQVFINGSPLVEDYLQVEPNYEYGPETIPADSYFMLGDNRNHSLDSHSWLNPFVIEDDIKGKVVCRYWPVNRIGGLY